MLISKTSMMNTSCRGSDDMPLHTHWREREGAPASVHLMIGIFITVVGTVAVVGNSLVVLTCIRFKELRTRSNLLILNLAVGDLLMCTIDFPLLALASFYNYWPFGTQVCRLYAFLTAIAGMVTINSLAAISADRYWAVVRRPSPRQQLSKCVMGIVVCAVWAYSLAWALCPLFGWGSYVLDGIQTTCTFDYLTRSWSNRSFVIAMSVGNFLLPFLIMVFCYTRIWITIREVKSSLENQGPLVSVGSSLFYFKNSRVPSVDERYSKLNTKLDYDSSLTNSMKKQMEDEIGSNSSHSPLKIVKKDDVTCKMDSKFYNASDIMCVKENDKNKEKMKISKRQGMRSNSKELTVEMRKSIPDGKNESNLIGNDICLPKRRYTSLDYKKQDKTGRDVSKTANHQIKESFRSKLSQNYDHPSMSKFYIEDNCLSKQRKLSTDFFNADTIETREGLSQNRTRTSRIIFEKIRTKYRSAFRNGLFLKQHRYRLHCEQKTMKIIMFLLVAFTASWCPYMIISLIGLFGDASHITYFTSVFPSLLAKTSMVFNPILYSITHPKVRKRIFALFCRRLNSNPGITSRLNQLRSSFTLSNSKT